MKLNPDEPIFVKGESKIESLPIEPSVKDILDKVLEQNKIILEQNARIIAVLSRPMFIMRSDDAS